jgi:hypothetical protein
MSVQKRSLVIYSMSYLEIMTLSAFVPRGHIAHRREGQDMHALSANLGGCQYEYRAIAHLVTVFQRV